MNIWYGRKKYILSYEEHVLRLKYFGEDDLIFWGWIDKIYNNKIIFHGFCKDNILANETAVHLILYTVNPNS